MMIIDRTRLSLKPGQQSARKLAFAALALLVCLGLTGWMAVAEEAAPAPDPILFKSDLSELPVGKLGKPFMVLAGKFSVSEMDGNKFIELPGEPLDTFNLLFGPSEKSGVSVSARIFGEALKKNTPAFGIGLNGVSGFRLMVSPGKRAIELLRGNETRAQSAFEWKSGVWTNLRLEAKPAADGKWLVSGKAWQEGDEPSEWLSYEDAKAPPNGRPSLWGFPFSGKSILFDDLMVMRAQ